MRKLKLLCVVAVGLMAMSSSCEKETNLTPTEPDDKTCYQGILLDTYCLSMYTIQVTDNQIGEKWTSAEGKTFNNVVTLRNVIGINARRGDKIYFKVDVEASKSNQPCTNENMICTQDQIPNLSNKKFCIKTILNKNWFATLANGIWALRGSPTRFYIGRYVQKTPRVLP
jgi:hypothetical protein